jgi:hypothetical protein
MPYELALVQFGEMKSFLKSPIQKYAQEISWKSPSISHFPKIGQEPFNSKIYSYVDTKAPGALSLYLGTSCRGERNGKRG